MVWYTLQEITLEVTYAGEESGAELAQLLHEFAWVSTAAVLGPPTLRLSVRPNTPERRVPPTAREVLRTAGFYGFEHGDAFYLTDGASLLHLPGFQGRAAAWLAPTFMAQPALLRRNFWTLGLLKLLRPLGRYGLHAAGVVTRQGQGILIVGNSGSGKSTLTIGLIRQGWRYLSDDALLLGLQPEGVAAWAFRRHCYVNADAAAAYVDLLCKAEAANIAVGRKRRVHLEATYPGQSVVRCIPQVLLFAHLVPHPRSALLPLDHSSALRHLLAQSGPQVFDRHSMAQHLEVLKRLVQQTATYELRAGLDLYQQPGLLGHLLTTA